MSQSQDPSNPTPAPRPTRPFRGALSRWLTVALSGVCEWPDVDYVQSYDGFEFTLLAETDRSPPAISIELGRGIDGHTARVAIRRFLSAYSWAYGQPAREDFSVGTGFPGGVGKAMGTQGGVRFVVPNFWLEYLPATKDVKGEAPHAHDLLGPIGQGLGEGDGLLKSALPEGTDQLKELVDISTSKLMLRHMYSAHVVTDQSLLTPSFLTWIRPDAFGAGLPYLLGRVVAP